MRSLAAARLVIGATAALVAAGCASHPPSASPMKDPLFVDGDSLSSENPRCATKIAADPFAYFRFTNRPFVDLVCARWASQIPAMPSVHAHGDAHLQQYAVAEDSRGLADFDASAIGPPIVDLARFATSLVLAWPSDPKAARMAIDALMHGYLRALDDPTATVPEPLAAARIRKRFAPTRRAWLDQVEKLIAPVRTEDLPRYRAGYADFVGQMKARDPTLDPTFFTIKVGGLLDVGIGSARTEKFLARVEGPTSEPDDDLIIEAKALDEGALGSCMRGADLGAIRVIRGQAQISNAPQRFLAAIKINGKPFYSHTWLVHYTELVTRDIGDGSELAEISEDVGLQLGRGHAKLEDSTRVPEQRRALRQAAEVFSPGLGDAAFDLAAQIIRAWSSYRTTFRPANVASR